MHQTTLRFGHSLWSDLDEAARDAGVSIAQYVREAAVARLANPVGREQEKRTGRAVRRAAESTERAAGLNRLNVLLEGILGGAGVAVVVLDQHQRVLTWNGASEGMWGVAPEDVVGKAFPSLDVGLPTD